MKIWIADGGRHEKTASGYGQLAQALHAGLADLGHEARFEQFDGVQACVYVCPPSSIRGRPGIPTGAFTMHESETLPDAKADWPERLNTLDFVITPTSWNKRIWERLGVHVPIEVVPLGVDDQTFMPPSGRVCRFLTVHENLGSPSSRENWLDTLTAYYEAFDARDRVELVIKTWRWKPQGLAQAQEDLVRRLGMDPASAPQVEVIDATLSPEELRWLYQRARLFVKNANREGWSLPSSEAVACGTRVAATEIQPLLSHLPVTTQWFAPGDVAELRYLLKREYRAFLADEKTTRRYSWHNTAAVLIQRLTERLALS